MRGIKSLRARLVFLLSFTLLPIGTIALVNAYFGYQHYRSQIATGAVAAGEDALRREEATIGRAETLLTVLKAMPLDDAGGVEQCRGTLVELLHTFPDFMNIVLFDREGRPLCSGIEGEGGLPAPFPNWFADALRGRPFSVSMAETAPGEEPAVVATMPMTNEANDVVGVLAATIRATTLEHAMRNVVLPEGGAMVVLDRYGRTLARRSNQTSADTWLPPDPLGTEEDARTSGVFDAKGRDGIERRYVLMPLAGDVFAVFGIPISTIGDAAHFLLYSNAASALLMWLAALVTAALGVSRLVTRPLRRIRRSIVAYSDGDVHARIRDIDDLPGEVQSLADTFNRMADAILARDEALRESVAQQKALTREVHHRVRNNLQIVNSLMSLQRGRAETASETAIFAEVQRRVTALGLVHGAIYQGDDLRSVKLSILLTDLCAATEQSLREAGSEPILVVQADDLDASADIAVPLAFLVTEVIGEVVFRRDGQPMLEGMRIILRRAGTGAILIVEGDQLLFPELSEDGAKRNGLSLLSGLVRQLGGTQTIDPDRTRITISIPNLEGAGRRPGAP
ncbi:sensor histidine kinase [Parvibaculum sp.]|uniref:sensor histidine kinase n=1 Tax=Parvibaculum sp. TaxID=2024848 RepID=UPI002BE82D30|nr:histidine kinase dimerization/phosphoacceptor domain -containing protein [Parvibaculum sp.]HUD51490.1 histidine kinase dimerization/phosphoacceptor domain -containing protein [Parvibaculum sp.]